MAAIFEHIAPVELAANYRQVDDVADYTPLADELDVPEPKYVTLGGNATLFLLGGSGGGSVEIAAVRATAGDPASQGAIAVPDLTVTLTEGQIKRVGLQKGLYMQHLVLLTPTGNVSALVVRRAVEGQ